MISDEQKKLASSLLMDLRSEPRFHALIELLQSLRPEVPQYQWHKDNIEEIKAHSLMQQGFDKVFHILKPK